MITLSATNMSLEVLLGGAVTTSQWEVVTAFVDITPTTYVPTGLATVTNSATPVTVVAAPAASTQRQVKYLSMYNADTVSGTVTVRINTGGTTRRTRVVTLATLESLVWDGVTWKAYTAAGAEKIDTGAVSASSAPNVFDAMSQRVLMSPLMGVNGFIMSSGVGYFAYVGQVATAITVKFVELIVSTAGAGAQVAELGIFSTPSAPNKANQSLTKLAATGTIGALTATGAIRNTASFAQAVSVGTHLWAGMRSAMATTQPQVLGLASDFAEGQYLTAAAPGVLTGAGPFAGVLVAADLSATWRCPDLRITLD